MSTPISEPISIAPQANLALYGALDDILAQAIEDGDAETAALVNQYLPGAVEYPGWSNELREIFGPAQPGNARHRRNRGGDPERDSGERRRDY